MCESNVYEDALRAASYGKLDFPGTYYLAYRDIPAIITKHVSGKSAIDIGCGTGRSTRFLSKLGFDTVGVDISDDMLKHAKKLDHGGDYRLVDDGDLGQFDSQSRDLALCAFTFDNIPTRDRKVRLFSEIARVLRSGGRAINLVSSPEIYVHEWASFSTRDFPENRQAKSGDRVRIIMTDVEDSRPVEDTLWSHEDYLDVYHNSGLEIEKIYRPLAKDSEPFEWVTETRINPWVIYVLMKTRS